MLISGLISSSFVTGIPFLTNRATAKSNDDDFTNALESTRTSTTSQANSTDSTFRTETPTTQSDDDFTNALESTKTQPPQPQKSNVQDMNTQQSGNSLGQTSLPTISDPTGIFKELRVTDLNELGYKYQAELGEGGTLSGEVSIMPNVNFSFTKKDLDQAASRSIPIFNISKNFKIRSDNSTELEQKVFIPYDILPEESVRDLEQLGPLQTIDSASITPASFSDMRNGKLISNLASPSLQQLNEPSLGLKPTIQNIADSTTEQTVTTGAEQSSSFKQKAYSTFKDTKGMLKGVVMYLKLIVPYKTIGYEIPNPLYEYKDAFDKFAKKLKTVNLVLDLLGYTADVVKINEAVQKAKDCDNSSPAQIKYFQEDSWDPIGTNPDEALSNAYTMLVLHAIYSAGKSGMGPITSFLLKDVSKYADHVREDILKSEIDAAEGFLKGCEKMKNMPMPSPKPLGVDRQPPPLVDETGNAQRTCASPGLPRHEGLTGVIYNTYHCITGQIKYHTFGGFEEGWLSGPFSVVAEFTQFRPKTDPPNVDPPILYYDRDSETPLHPNNESLPTMLEDKSPPTLNLKAANQDPYKDPAYPPGTYSFGAWVKVFAVYFNESGIRDILITFRCEGCDQDAGWADFLSCNIYPESASFQVIGSHHDSASHEECSLEITSINPPLKFGYMPPQELSTTGSTTDVPTAGGNVEQPTASTTDVPPELNEQPIPTPPICMSKDANIIQDPVQEQVKCPVGKNAPFTTDIPAGGTVGQSSTGQSNNTNQMPTNDDFTNALEATKTKH